jgi:hypothetical protein
LAVELGDWTETQRVERMGLQMVVKLKEFSTGVIRVEKLVVKMVEKWVC